jgi:hypothetical protein
MTFDKNIFVFLYNKFKISLFIFIVIIIFYKKINFLFNESKTQKLNVSILLNVLLSIN